MAVKRAPAGHAITWEDPATLTRHPDNPRRGDVDAIRESIRVHGFVGMVVVQESTGFIVVGNHRTEAAVAEAVALVPVMRRKIGNKMAKKLLAADNQSSDRAFNDDDALIEMLGSLVGESEDTEAALEGTLVDGWFYEELKAALAMDAPDLELATLEDLPMPTDGDDADEWPIVFKVGIKNAGASADVIEAVATVLKEHEEKWDAHVLA